MSSILRSGRLPKTKENVVRFISSISYDARIAHSTILVNEAHILGLVAAKTIDRNHARNILRALQECESGIKLRVNAEDVHVLIEEYVTRKTGKETGGRMHLGKSRNDQVVTAIRISLREEMLEIAHSLIHLENELLRLARRHTRTVFPGYTHLQPAQPISFAHYLLALGDSFLRDVERVIQTFQRINKSPMGAAAIAGTSFNLNRDFVSKLLGFDGLVENSLDAIGTRDFAVETLGVCSIIALDISRFVQDLIFYSAADVGLIEIPDEFASTSSIMPQKKNPDPLEVIRARCAKVIGNLMSASTTLHALPSGFNLDFQEVTPLLWSSVDIIKSCLKILCEFTSRIKVERGIADRESLRFTVATEIANILVREEKLPFRTAHHAVGRAVKSSLDGDLRELTKVKWKQILGRIPSERTLRLIGEACDLRLSLGKFRTTGSPNPKQTSAGIDRRKIEVHTLSREINTHSKKMRRSVLYLKSRVRSL